MLSVSSNFSLSYKFTTFQKYILPLPNIQLEKSTTTPTPHRHYFLICDQHFWEYIKIDLYKSFLNKKTRGAHLHLDEWCKLPVVNGNEGECFLLEAELRLRKKAHGLNFGTGCQIIPSKFTLVLILIPHFIIQVGNNNFFFFHIDYLFAKELKTSSSPPSLSNYLDTYLLYSLLH